MRINKDTSDPFVSKTMCVHQEPRWSCDECKNPDKYVKPKRIFKAVKIMCVKYFSNNGVN